MKTFLVILLLFAGFIGILFSNIYQLQLVLNIIVAIGFAGIIWLMPDKTMKPISKNVDIGTDEMARAMEWKRKEAEREASER